MRSVAYHIFKERIMRTFLIIILLVAMLSPVTASAKDFGIQGPVRPIAERNPVEVIQEQLKDMDPTDLKTLMVQSTDEKRLVAPLNGWTRSINDCFK